jgi:hypothetical protein
MVRVWLYGLISCVLTWLIIEHFYLCVVEITLGMTRVVHVHYMDKDAF